MKRHGHLLEQVADPGNLRLAFWKAAKGKRAKADCRAFQAGLEKHLLELRQELLEGRVRVGDYHLFRVHDPKERTICAAAFRERVLHHALMNLCEPVLDRAAIQDSYACRKGKGRQAAVERAMAYARSHGWFLKLDVRKYFDSVQHAVVLRQLAGKFKDRAVLDLFAKILASYETGPGRGLPIGNLTSQHLANFHLGTLDRFIKETLRRRAYVRYMDDFVVWGSSGAELREVWQAVARHLTGELKLDLKGNTVLNKTAFGMDFLGYRVFPHELRLSRRSKLRFARRFRCYEQAWAEGHWSEQQLQQRMEALVAITLPARARDWRRQVMQRFGVVANRLEPRPAGRQLEQQREQLPVCQPQQQHPGQPEQQQRVPCGSAPSST